MFSNIKSTPEATSNRYENLTYILMKKDINSKACIKGKLKSPEQPFREFSQSVFPLMLSFSFDSNRSIIFRQAETNFWGPLLDLISSFLRATDRKWIRKAFWGMLSSLLGLFFPSQLFAVNGVLLGRKITATWILLDASLVRNMLYFSLPKIYFEIKRGEKNLIEMFRKKNALRRESFFV